MPFAEVKARVVARLRDALRDGRLRPGERLPTERALAVEQDCDRRTARAALDILETEGLVRRLSPHVRVAAHPHERSPAAFMRNSVLLVTEERAWETQRASVARSDRMREIDLGVLGAARAEGLHVLTFNRSRLDVAELASALALHPRGVLVTEAALSEGEVLRLLIPVCRKWGTALVTCTDTPDGRTSDRVVSDHEAGARLLVDWLAGRGCRRILQTGVSPEEVYWVAARSRGYAEGCQRAGLTPLPRMHVPGVFWVERGRSEFDRAARFFAGYLAEWLVPGRVDAIMAQNDIDALLVLEACRILGVAGPDRPLVTGYDRITEEHPVLSWSVGRPAATIDKRNGAQGAAMLALAMERASGALPQGPVRRWVAPELVVGTAAYESARVSGSHTVQEAIA